MSLEVGNVMLNGKYRILRIVGKGGMARVWLAEELTFGRRQVAIKEPRADLAPDDRQEVERRYAQEVEVCAALEQSGTQNIVRAITAEPYGHSLLLVLQYMPGGDLETLLRKHPDGLPVKQSVDIALDLLRALEGVHAHQLEIVHRDIKPSNILFDAEGRAHLADFGLAQLAGKSGRSQLRGGQHPGTWAYMPPEQESSTRILTPAADLFAAGCVLFEMLIGQRYKRWRSGTAASSLRKDVPDWLDDILLKALESDPWDRWGSAQEMTCALQVGQNTPQASQKLEERMKRSESRSAEQDEMPQRPKGNTMALTSQEQTGQLETSSSHSREGQDRPMQDMQREPRIFCPECGELILDLPTCPACGWQRLAVTEGVGEAVWVADLGTRLIRPYCRPVLAAGHYYLGTEDGTLLALDLATGEVAWEQSLGAGCMAHSLTTDGEHIFVGCEDMRPIPTPGKAFLALDASSGDEVWRYPTTAHSLSAAAIAHGVVYFTASDGQLHAVDAASGERRWAASHPAWSPAAPAVGEGVVCAGGRGEALVAHDAVTGAERWRFPAENWFASQPCVTENRVYACCWDGNLYALETRTGRLLWDVRGERGEGFTTSPTVAGGQVFAGCRIHPALEGERRGAYALLALDAEDGRELWRFPTERHIFTPPTVAGDMVFFGSSDGILYAVDASTAEELWRIEVKSRAIAQPLVEGDRVVFGCRDGMVCAVRCGAPPREEMLAPEIYLAQEQYAEAAAAYALQGDLPEAAALYEGKLSAPREAARLYERDGQLTKAAGLWVGLGELARARDLYREADDKSGLASVLAQMGQPLEAARLYEEVEDLQAAAPLYEQAGDRARAADLYSHLGQSKRARHLWESLGAWEKLAQQHVSDGMPAEAARLLEEHGQWERAASLYEEGGQLGDALRLRVQLAHWEQVVDLASQVGDHEQRATALEQLQRAQQAAEAYQQAAEQAAAVATVDPEQVAGLYERAARLYGQVYREGKRLACRGEVRRYRRLPEVVIEGKARETFIENQWNMLDLRVENVGFGEACDIHIVLSDNFETRRQQVIPGLAAADHRQLQVHARPREGECGARVPLEITVVYDDARGGRYEVIQVESVPVVPHRGGLLGSETPVAIHIHGDLVEPGAKKVEGTEVQAGGQVGDRVVIAKGPGRELALEDGVQGERVTVRRSGGPVRRCPRCNLPVQEQDHRYCPDCGAPLWEECG